MNTKPSPYAASYGISAMELTVMRAVKANLEEDRLTKSIDALASELGCSRSHLYNRLNSLRRKGFIDYFFRRTSQGTEVLVKMGEIA